MVASLLPLAFGLLFAAPADTLPAPRDVVHQAIRAVEADSATRLSSIWKSRLERDSTDRVAVLGLASLARLQYDYPEAERLYRRLLNSSATDRFRVYARL